MKYSIDWSEKKTTSTGKEKIDAHLIGEDLKKHEGVTIWGDFPNFANLMTGGVVEGDLVEKQNGQFLNKTLYAPKVPGARAGGAGVAKAQERKAEYIKEAQDRKEDSIAYFNSVNSAISLLQALGANGMTNDSVQNFIKTWREWFLKEHEVYKDGNNIPFD